jgi:multisubunit Na+/H+ antiporter MnhB subunit
MEFAPLVVAGAMIWTAVSALKLVSNKKWNDLATLVVVVLVGVGVAFLLRASDFSAGIDVGSIALGKLNVASTVLFGYGLSSFARVAYEAKKAVDNNESAVEPKLFPPT